MMHRYGKHPYEVAVIHGGPGAMGSLAPVARTLSADMGVIEPWQSKDSINSLVDELHEQISSVYTKPLTLIGHSWGAWLSCLYAAEFPDHIRQIIMVASPPLNVMYFDHIMEQRKLRMTKTEWDLFTNLLMKLDGLDETANEPEALMKTLCGLMDKSDNYDLIAMDGDDCPVNRDMFLSVWMEAQLLCASGELIAKLRTIRCPLHLVHGEHDTYPIDGVIVPLRINHIPFQQSILAKCGHKPFRERQAMNLFYQTLRKIILPSSVQG